MAKIGVNTQKSPINVPACSFVIVDNTSLTKRGVQNLISGTKKLFIVTSNKNHPAFQLKDSVEILYYPKKINFKHLFQMLKRKYGAKRVTIQSGGTLNSVLLRDGLIDFVSVVIAPTLIGGKETSTLVDGKSLSSVADLKKIRTLKLENMTTLKDSYVHLFYKVRNL